LTTLAQRFSLRETLEATIDPSANISDRYHSKVIITKDGDQHTGMALQQANGEYLVLRSDSKRIRVLPEDIEDVRDSTVSAMPANLLDSLSTSEVADLMAFLMASADRIAEAESSPNR
jgi:putative heme-binding domain-containing protein